MTTIKIISDDSADLSIDTSRESSAAETPSSRADIPLTSTPTNQQPQFQPLLTHRRVTNKAAAAGSQEDLDTRDIMNEGSAPIPINIPDISVITSSISHSKTRPYIEPSKVNKRKSELPIRANQKPSAFIKPSAIKRPFSSAKSTNEEPVKSKIRKPYSGAQMAAALDVFGKSLTNIKRKTFALSKLIFSQDLTTASWGEPTNGTFVVETEPFASGGMRNAFKATLPMNQPHLDNIPCREFVLKKHKVEVLREYEGMYATEELLNQRLSEKVNIH